MQIDEIEDLKDKEVILYCRSGNRSGQACMFLDAMGFKNTRNLVGGILAWQEKIMRIKFRANDSELKTYNLHFQLRTSHSLQP
jgi:predicted sulfurtransferase